MHHFNIYKTCIYYGFNTLSHTYLHVLIVYLCKYFWHLLKYMLIQYTFLYISYINI